MLKCTDKSSDYEIVMTFFPSVEMINALTTFSLALIGSSGLPRVISKKIHKKGIAGLLQLVHNRVVEGILVLL